MEIRLDLTEEQITSFIIDEWNPNQLAGLIVNYDKTFEDWETANQILSYLVDEIKIGLQLQEIELEELPDNIRPLFDLSYGLNKKQKEVFLDQFKQLINYEE